MLFPLRRPRPLPQRRNLLAGLAAATAVTLLFTVLMLLFPPRYDDDNIHTTSSSSRNIPPLHCRGASQQQLGEFGEMMVSMLPRDLAFTAFVPSPESFRRVLNLRPPNDSVARDGTKKKAASDDATYAVVSRVLGFSAIPRALRSADVPLREPARLLDSVSGLRIYAWRDEVDGALVVNGVRSECVDIVRGETVVHVMAGVLMDAEFQRSFAYEFED